MYRYPSDPVEESVYFYQEEYEQGFTTDMLDDAALKSLTDSSFVGHEKDYAPLIALVAYLGIAPGMRICDFGCSWGGGGSWKFTRSGFDEKSFDIQRPRARCAREKLDVDVIYDVDTLATSTHPDGTCTCFSPIKYWTTRQAQAIRCKPPAGFYHAGCSWRSSPTCRYATATRHPKVGIGSGVKYIPTC
ncbi:hypothetical protein LY56_01312 [Roseinatronobacter thiooxidans]|uniref:Methyltransferase family protein n=1 Tax=Roseinatronobacter thiooxidans TaxID=121821 RepID=A0A2W7S5H5_9RHOB|nr:hypothetical protein LY56_01312 [Roseinatronobacter thiooxidans]